MISEAAAKTIRTILLAELPQAEVTDAWKGEDKAVNAANCAIDEINLVLDLYANAWEANPDMMTEEQKKEAVREALFRVLPQYKLVRFDTDTFDRNNRGVERIEVRLELLMT